MNEELLEHLATSPAGAVAPHVHPDLLAAQQDAPAPSLGSLRPPADIWRDIQELKRLEAESRAAAEARKKALAADYTAHLAGASDAAAIGEITELQLRADLHASRIEAAMADMQAAEARIEAEKKADLASEFSKLMADRVKAGDDVTAAIDVLIQRMNVIRRLDIAAVQAMNHGKRIVPVDKRKQVLVLESFMCMANPETPFDWMALHMRHRTGETWFAKDVGGQSRAFDEFVRNTSAQAINELAHLLE